MDGNNVAVAAGQRDHRRLLQALPGDLGPATVAVGATTCIIAWRALYAAASQAPPVYSLVLIGAFLGGVGAIWAALWAAVGGRRNISFVIFCVSFVPLIIAAAHGEFDPELLVQILNALA